MMCGRRAGYLNAGRAVSRLAGRGALKPTMIPSIPVIIRPKEKQCVYTVNTASRQFPYSSFLPDGCPKLRKCWLTLWCHWDGQRDKSMDFINENTWITSLHFVPFLSRLFSFLLSFSPLSFFFFNRTYQKDTGKNYCPWLVIYEI